MKRLHHVLRLFVCLFLLLGGTNVEASVSSESLHQTVMELSRYKSRSTATIGSEKAADYISDRLTKFGLNPFFHTYEIPRRIHNRAQLKTGSKTVELSPVIYNAITPQKTNGEISGPVYYVGTGSALEIDEIPVAGSILLVDFLSGKNYLTLASHGAKAVIFIGDLSKENHYDFARKEELTPLQFPCFFLSKEKAINSFGPLKNTKEPLVRKASLTSDSRWEKKIARNVYAFVEGSDPSLKEELFILSAHFDTEEYVAGDSPGADEASSIATFLELSKRIASNPPKRPVLLLATSGQAQNLAGLREAIWNGKVRSRDLRRLKRDLSKRIKTAKGNIQLLEKIDFPLREDPARDKKLSDILKPSIDIAVDQISRKLTELRLAGKTTINQAEIRKTANTRFRYRRLGWSERFDTLDSEQLELFKQILPHAIERNKKISHDARQQQKILKSGSRLRSLLRDHEVAFFIDLHLSSHGNGVGPFHQGWLYNLKPTINRVAIYSPVAELLEQEKGLPVGRATYRNSLTPTHLRSWDSWFLDRPPLGAEVSNLAGIPGLSLVTTGDARSLWGSPADRPERVDWTYLHDQAKLVERLVMTLIDTDRIHGLQRPRDGFTTVTARTNLLLQGELFANHPAADTVILAYQGLRRYYAMVDEAGLFSIRGVADKKHVLDKLILEGYRFDDATGEVIWAIDKKATGKKNYRLKLLRRSMQTNLIMFNCRQTTIFDLLEPRNLNYMTKLQLFDGRRDAPPEHFWYSRIDTRDSVIASIYTEPGTFLKLTLSDTVLTHKIILTNGQEDSVQGLGYPVEKFPAIHNTTLHAARDAWTLLLPRIDNLERHGIHDKRITGLRDRGLSALHKSEDKYGLMHYSQGRAFASEALALASRVYSQIEKTQKDVLFGVLFYVALFVPFAFVMERFIFHSVSIYKRIAGFTSILILLIAIIYNVHPAFELAYSPMVVILAFFIIGLSLMVSLILFFRFEEEMAQLQQRATLKGGEEISRWKAFTAAFFLGISNLRRRKLRTLLTCTTLVILSFTIMSFTTIKSSRDQVRLLFQEKAPYQGLLLTRMNHRTLPPEAAEILLTSLGGKNNPAPRVWLEAKNPSEPVSVPLTAHGREATLQGLLGLTPAEAEVTGIDSLLTSGRWLRNGERNVIILEENVASQLGLSVGSSDQLTLWGTEFTLIGTYSTSDFEQAHDLNGEILTPVIFPEEGGELTEEEAEAMESGEDVRSFQSRYRHLSPSEIGIVPAATLFSVGGALKSVAVQPSQKDALNTMARELSDRFSLAIFTGETDGVWLYNMSDTLNYSGVPNIIVPLLISILIVLNTMISSVYERKSEIGVYTSVGLAPSHVGFLFVAEALALGIISVVLGYLVAQISASLFGNTALWVGITVNYSSMAGVAAMILVLLVVLISVIYPSKVASRIAIPDVNMSFNLPQPIDNSIRVTLPFLTKYREHASIGGFLYEYLESHKDISHGLFSTNQVELLFSCSTVDEIAQLVRNSQASEDLKCLHIRTNVWLAPFDFGIMQRLDIQFCPTQEGGDFLEIRLNILRQSGESTVWHRINTSFLHELRKQLLIWRSLDEETHNKLATEFKERIEQHQKGFEEGYDAS